MSDSKEPITLELSTELKKKIENFATENNMTLDEAVNFLLSR